METLRVGDPLDKSIDIGAIVDAGPARSASRSWSSRARPRAATLLQASCELPANGLLLSAHAVHRRRARLDRDAEVEIFGPVAVAMTFRTPDEAVQLANNTRYGLAASVWSENINLALDIAARVKAGVVWINSTNLFDAAAGFGGYRESGFGREGGREGLYEYLVPDWREAAAGQRDSGASPRRSR